MNITVTAEDIDKAHAFRDYTARGGAENEGWACDCPLAYAIKRTLPNTDAFVTYGLIQWRDEGKCVTKTMSPSRETKNFIIRWDTIKDAEPGFTFTLEAKETWMS